MLAKHFDGPRTLRLVLDANVLVAEVRWIVKKRKDPKARTALQEALTSGLLVAFAPTYLEEEMRNQLATLAYEEGLSCEALFAAWDDYRRVLKFYDASPPAAGRTTHGIDPKDTPYVETYLAVGASAIMTSDPHLSIWGLRQSHSRYQSSSACMRGMRVSTSHCAWAELFSELPRSPAQSVWPSW
jgi:predicted nucleic acid-binding protein